MHTHTHMHILHIRNMYVCILYDCRITLRHPQNLSFGKATKEQNN